MGQLVCAGGPTPLATVRVANGLDRPLYVTHAPSDRERIFILEKSGAIWIVKRGLRLTTPFLDVDAISDSSGERGLLGMAFHPDYPNTNAFFVHYSNLIGDTVIAQYRVSADPDIADPIGDIIFTVGQPFTNHNGGWIDFGPNDAYLYIALGDGGSQRDPNNMGQRTDDLLGNILRIDVGGDDFPANSSLDYAIPPDNPFVGIGGADEIWAYGFRNPWRCAFDRLTGDLYIADVGQNTWEEVNFQDGLSPGGENYGWRCFEGTSCTSFGGVECNCIARGVVAPIHAYLHVEEGKPSRCSVTGGEVYRGCGISDLAGTYFFADFCSKEIWSFRYDGVEVSDFQERTSELEPPGALDFKRISSFGRDAAGELYICDYDDGEVFKIVSNPPPALVASDPPHEAIDAGLPFSSDDKSSAGWDSLEYAFSSPVLCLGLPDFTVSQEGGALTPPAPSDVADLGAGRYELVLSRVLEPVTWTTIYHHESGSTVRLGFLPGDVDESRATTPLDILAWINLFHLPPTPFEKQIWSRDIDRSGVVDAADVEALIMLLDGSEAFGSFLGAALP